MPRVHNPRYPFAELVFPLKGIDVTSEYQEQPEGTTPVAVNVRGTEMLILNDRGGSRPGLTKYADLTAKGVTPLQHLAVIVDPTTPTLLTNDPIPDGLLDPSSNGGGRNPGRYVRRKGAAVQPNRNVATPNIPPPDITFVQGMNQGWDFSAERREPQFDTQPGDNNFLVAVVVTLATGGNIGVGVQVQNDLLNNYTQAGTYYEIEDTDSVAAGVRLSIWYRTATAGASETTVKVTPADEVSMCVVLLEYAGVTTGSPVDATSGNVDESGFPFDPTMTTGTIDMGAADNLIVAAFASARSIDTGVAGAGYTVVEDHGDGSIDNSDIQLFVVHRFNQTADQAATGSFAGGGQDYAALGVAFKKGF